MQFGWILDVQGTITIIFPIAYKTHGQQIQLQAPSSSVSLTQMYRSQTDCKLTIASKTNIGWINIGY